MGSLVDRLKGKFIVIDGPDGSGKTTQLGLLERSLTSQGAEVEIVVDPGGTHTGQKIRGILLGRDTEPIAPMCETFLFMASRAQLVHEKVRPAMAKDKVVLGDRFISSTLAYQGALNVDTRLILELGEKAVQGTWPDLTLLLDLPVEEGIGRAGAERAELGKKQRTAGQLALFGDRMESRDLDYHQEVRRRFQGLGTDDSPYPCPVAHLDATGRPEEVHARVLEALEEHFGHA
jgi:dTMP kinase